MLIESTTSVLHCTVLVNTYRNHLQLYPSKAVSFSLTQTPSEVYSEKNTNFKLFIGNSDHASDLLQLETLGITYILNMAASDPTCQLTQEVYGEGLKVMRITAGDMPGYDLSQYFKMTFEFIEEARSKEEGILVHCVAGASRSSTIVIAYLMQL